jgi:hypothetical protein
MKIAAHVLAYNVNRFIAPVLKNIEPHVNKIYVAHPLQPWSYEFHSENSMPNPTTLEDILSANIGDKLTIIHGSWSSEEEMRNACLLQAKIDGCDWLITQDADEFYPKSSWQKIFQALSSASEDQIITTWYNLWKKPDLVIVNRDGTLKSTNAGFALRCKEELFFVDKRVTNAKSTLILDAPCYHYGYVLSDNELLRKINTWGHTLEFDRKKWFSLKWKNWVNSTRNLHPVDPGLWKKAQPLPLDLDCSFGINWGDLSNSSSEPSFIIMIENLVYDVRSQGAIQKWLNRAKRLFYKFKLFIRSF